MNERDYLIDWIHKVESDPSSPDKVSKRLPSLVTELYFELKLSVRPEFGLYGPLTFGWTVCRGNSSNSRHWFKISERDQGTLREINEALITKISSVDPQNRFFVVTYEVGVNEGSVPTVKWEILEVEFDGSRVKRTQHQTDAENICKRLSELVAGGIRSRNHCNHNGIIAPWLKSLDPRELRRLFVTRCFMNFSELYLTDVDAVGMNESDDVQIIEFKRKGPAMGIGYKLVLPHNTNDAISRYLAKAAALKKKNKQDIQKEFRDTSIWKEITGACFGLDTSHAKNVELCDKAKIIYRYVIWNTAEASVENLFTEKLESKQLQEFLVLDIRPMHIEKISMTFGPDSGSYTTNVRFQLMVPAIKFNKIILSKN